MVAPGRDGVVAAGSVRDRAAGRCATVSALPFAIALAAPPERGAVAGAEPAAAARGAAAPESAALPSAALWGTALATPALEGSVAAPAGDALRAATVVPASTAAVEVAPGAWRLASPTLVCRPSTATSACARLASAGAAPVVACSEAGMPESAAAGVVAPSGIAVDAVAVPARSAGAVNGRAAEGVATIPADEVSAVAGGVLPSSLPVWAGIAAPEGEGPEASPEASGEAKVAGPAVGTGCPVDGRAPLLAPKAGRLSPSWGSVPDAEDATGEGVSMEDEPRLPGQASEGCADAVVATGWPPAATTGCAAMAVALVCPAAPSVEVVKAALAGAVTAPPEPLVAGGRACAGSSPASDDVAAETGDAPALSAGPVVVAAPVPEVPDGTTSDC